MGRTAARPLATLALSVAIVFLLGARASAAAPDNAIQFDGANDYVTFGQATSTLGATQFTLETWFMRTGTGTPMGTGTNGLPASSALPLVTKGRGEGETPANLNTNYFLGLDSATNKLVADFEDTVDGGNHPALAATGTLVATPNVWHHAAATYNGTTWRLYLDGKLDRAVVVGSFTPESNSIQHAAIGSALTSTGVPGASPGHFQGLLDEVRIWNVVRTGAQIRANKDSETPTPTTGLRGNWHLDEGSGTTAGDSSGQNVTGTLTNGPVWVGGYTFPPDANGPAQVQNLAATPGNTTVNLSWSANGESDLAGYNVYRALSSPVPTNGTPLNGDDLLQTTNFNDTGLTNGNPYFYALVAVDGSNNASTPVEATATPSGGGGPANALQFNGSSQYVRFGTAGASTDKLNASTFTLEVWFNRSGAGVGTDTSSAGGGGFQGAIPLLAKGRGEAENSNVDINYFLGLDSSGHLAVDYEEGAGQTQPGQNHGLAGSTVVTQNAWHHAAATFDGTTLKLYLDGKRDGILSVGANRGPRSDSIHRTSIGSALNSTGVAAGFFQGQLDEARVWTVARTGQQIRDGKDDQLTSGTGLAGRWGLDEGSGTTAADSVATPTALNGTLVNTPTWVAGYTFPQDTNAPANPQSLVATGGNNQVGLVWSANSEPDLAGYNVFRALSPGVPTGGTPLNGDDLVTGTAFTDATAANGTPYYYVVAAVDGSNNASGSSNEVNATPGAGAGDLVLVGAGDIADCGRTQDADTAALIAAIPGNVFTIGDNVYANGTAAEFTNCYQPTWGAFKARTRPTVGNHDFGNGTTASATPYFDYFNGVGNQSGPAGDRALGYYSYDIGTGPNTWHVVVLNSECESGSGYWLPGGCAAGSAQDLWLKNDLATAATNNIIAMFHKPRWSSAGGLTHMQQLWQDLYDGGADIVLGGHLHNYERFAPMAANGTADPTFGVREFVVGTGGAALTGFGTILGTSEVRNSSTYGVIKLSLHASSYDWQFLPIAGQTFTDSGTASTHGAPGNTPPTLNPVGNKSAQVGTQLAFTATATDPDAGTTLTFSLANGSGGSVPAGASITGGGNFTWTPTAGQVGPATFDVCVSDGTASDCETITVTVSSSVTLVGDWKADEGSGATLVNSSSLGATNNGTILGNPTWVAGQHGQAIRFDGTGDYATVADNSSLDISGAITMAAWVKPEKTATQYLIKKATQGGTDGYELSLATTGFAFRPLQRDREWHDVQGGFAHGVSQQRRDLDASGGDL